MNLLRRTQKDSQNLNETKTLLSSRSNQTPYGVARAPSPIENRNSKIHNRSSLDRVADDNNDRMFTETLMPGNSANNSPTMKKRAFIGVAIAVVVLIGVVAIILVPAREPVSLSLLQYLPRAQPAKLKLTNNSSKTITYLTDYAGGAVFAVQKTSTGWTSPSPELLSGTRTDGLTGKTMPIYASADPRFMTNGPGYINGTTSRFCTLTISNRVKAPCFMPSFKPMALQFESAPCASSRKEKWRNNLAAGSIGSKAGAT
jgi:hypothetical protein